MNEPYYRIIRTNDGSVKTVQMQWFDEHDYDQSRLYPGKYGTEEEADRAALRMGLRTPRPSEIKEEGC